jgi:ketosteroid isomerase-like protein
MFLGCTPSAEQPESNRRESAAHGADVQAVLDVEQSVFNAQIAGDLEAWLDSFAEDAIVMAPNLPAVTNKLAIGEWYAPYFEQFHLHEEVDEREVEVAGDWAYIRAHWVWTLTPKSGGKAVMDTGKSIWILRASPTAHGRSLA